MIMKKMKYELEKKFDRFILDVCKLMSDGYKKALVIRELLKAKDCLNERRDKK